MARKSRKTPSRAERRAALAQKQAQQNKQNAIIAGIVLLLVLAFLAWQLWPEAEGVVLEGERPLATISPEERNDYFNTPPPMSIDTSKEYEAIIQTDKGEMRLRLFDDEAPLTVNNFVFLANQGFYDGTTFHRVLEGFMAQGGDPSGTGAGGPGYQFADEFDDSLSFNRRGLLAMANSGPATNGSQFFITFNAESAAHLTGLHTIFGELIEGDEVLAALSLRDPGFAAPPGDSITRIDIIEK